ncbi:YoaK family protein [Geothrix sp. 21YS21S-4]|uniref:YoaK family protein n=1 Tax=Geothrix sp. 21YS21S-4 TaxID=3068889 RepID=UPI0027B8B2AA|nr:YoaK family protein [Geothrix sp. 21YS21S-4]
MRRIPRYLQMIAARYLRRLLGNRLTGHQLQTAVEAALATLPIQEKLLVREGSLRSESLNRQLAWAMAFVAGAVNAGGFLAVSHYTSHMTGVVSSMADELAGGDLITALAALAMMVSFLAGAFVCTLLISFGQRHRMRSRYALTMALEAVLLLVFGFMGNRLQQEIRLTLPTTVMLLCFIMGLHNAVTSIISGAAVRTTHLTGTVTDIGIELGRLAYVNVHHRHGRERIVANRAKLKLLLLILVSFLGGGVMGALGFRHIGFKVTVPLAGFLCFLAARPLLLEIRLLLHRLGRAWVPED